MTDQCGCITDEGDIVFLVRNDGLFDMLKHPRGVIKFGLTKTEKEAYTSARPDWSVQLVYESKQVKC